MSATGEYQWWQRGVIYQIYPRSFMDSNGDGAGDLPGITSRLEYCRWLGVDCIWLSPFYPSPMADFGYDVSDYVDVDPVFGTLDDFDQLMAEARRLGLKVLLDYIPNHSSDRHPWFIESRSSRTSARRDWYIWRDPAAGGGPPNNWLSVFGGSAWEWDEATGQYYCHTYLKEQPDLNWRNPHVESAMCDVLRFWLERGVDGFRVDAIARLIKDDQFRDNPPNADYTPDQNPYKRLLALWSSDRPEVHDVVARLRRVVDEYPGRVLIGEAYLPFERVVAYYGAAGGGVHFPFNFRLIRLPWEARAIASGVEDYENLLPRQHWPNWVLGNHDKPRVASRVGKRQARVAAMLLLTLRGTPTLYYGDELAMRDVPIPPDLVQDPWEKNVPGLGLGRDPQRTPMQWDDTAAAGFTTGAPWLPVAADYRQTNVARLSKDDRSILSLYRRLLRLRASEPALHGGDYLPCESPAASVAYLRQASGKRFLIALSFGAEPVQCALPGGGQGRIRLSTHLDRENEPVAGAVSLRGDEGLIIEVLATTRGAPQSSDGR